MATTPLNGPWMPGFGPVLAPQITDAMKNEVATRQAEAGGAPPPSLSNDIVMPSSVPSLGIPAPLNVTSSETMGDQAKYHRLVNSGSGIDQLTRPVDAQGLPTGQHVNWAQKLGAGVLRAADIAGSVFNGTRALEAAIPGTSEHHQLLVRQAARNVATDQEQNLGDARTDDAQAQAEQRRALAVQENAKADALANPKPTNGALLYDKAGTPIGYQGGDGQMYGPNDPNLPQGVRDVLGAAGPKKTIEEQAFEHAVGAGASPIEALGQVYGAKNAKDASMPQQYLDAIASGDTVKAGLIRKVINDTSTQPKIDVHAANAPTDVGTWAPGFDKNKNPVLYNSKTGEVKANTAGFARGNPFPKAGSDEEKRADMAKNLGENIDMLDEITQRRPDLFGPVAGRWTEMRNAVGTSDPDITQLEAIRHQLGMVAQSAHGMRSAQGVASAANSLLNGFHNSAEATRAALEAARSSVRTFTDDANNPGASRGAGLPPAASDLITVQLPGQKPGQIHASQRAKFLQENPGAKVIENAK